MQFPYRHVTVSDTAGDSGRQAERDVRRGHVQRRFVSDDDFYQQNFRRQIPSNAAETTVPVCRASTVVEPSGGPPPRTAQTYCT